MIKTRERKSVPGFVREKPEFDHEALDIRRTARVVAGGRRFSFRVAVVAGNRNGRVGVGLGKGPDVATAMEKALANAKKNMIDVPLTEKKTISHEVVGKVSAARVLLKPAREGQGLVAGGSVRHVAALAGIRNITAKILGRTTNKMNNARAAMEALKKLKT